MLVEKVEQIIKEHVPDEDHPCWANQRYCKGCTVFDDEGLPTTHTYFRTWPWSAFPKHQAQLIVEAVGDQLGCR